MSLTVVISFLSSRSCASLSGQQPSGLLKLLHTAHHVGAGAPAANRHDRTSLPERPGEDSAFAAH